MASDAADFDALVERLEETLQRSPAALRRRAMFAAAFGYIGFLAWVLSIAAVGALCFIGALFIHPDAAPWVMIVGAALLALALWRTVEVLWPPAPSANAGRLDLRKTPKLRELLLRQCPGLGAARIHRVFLTPDLNAAVTASPRLGILGWPRNVLYLGLPLMDVLTPRQFEAVLAHEIAHVSARHGRFSRWIYRTRLIWQRMFIAMEQPVKSSAGLWLRQSLASFLRWYWPRFHAYFFVLSRDHEYLADRCAADWAGKHEMAEALWRIDLSHRRLDREFWPELWKLANVQALPPDDITARLLAALQASPAPQQAQRWIDQAAGAQTDNSDTHPALPDRLRAFGGSLANCRALGVPLAPQPSAAEYFLEGEAEALRQLVDQSWRDEMEQVWRQRHAKASSLSRRMRQLDGVAASEADEAGVLWEKAQAALDLEGPKSAAPLLCRLLEIQPAHAAAKLALGRHLLEEGRPEGEALLCDILDQPEHELTPLACEALSSHFQATGKDEQLQHVRECLRRYHRAQMEAQQERTTVSASDELIPHSLTDDELTSLESLMMRQTELDAAWLVGKRLRHFPEQPLHVLCVRTRCGLLGKSHSNSDHDLVRRLIPLIRLPGRLLIIAPHGGFRRLARKVMRREEALIYSR